MNEKEIYQEIKERINSVKLFNNYSIDIIIDSNNDDNKRKYKVKKLEFQSDIKDNFSKEFSSLIDNENRKIENKNWNIFYAYKEIFQLLANSKIYKFNYFRGQNNNWKLQPGLFRYDLDPDFIKNYDQIYKKICKEYPDEIRYIPLNEDDLGKVEERACQLALLQHYGYRTSLLDITENPYIALQFMVIGCNENKWSSNTIYAFSIDEVEHSMHNIYVSTLENRNNARMRAQRGAFLDYDRLYRIEQSKIALIPLVKIQLKFVSSKEQKINSELEKISNLINKVGEEDRTIEFLNNVREQYNLKKSHINEIKDSIYKFIKEDMVKKLREFYYFQEDLFPDFNDYLTFTKNKYLVKENTKQLND